jgi:hypothetical protein
MDLEVLSQAFGAGFLVVGVSAILGLGIYKVIQIIEMWG